MLYFYFLKHEIHHNGSFTFLGPEPLGQVFFIVTCLIAMTFFSTIVTFITGTQNYLNHSYNREIALWGTWIPPPCLINNQSSKYGKIYYPEYIEKGPITFYQQFQLTYLPPPNTHIFSCRAPPHVTCTHCRWWNGGTFYFCPGLEFNVFMRLSPRHLFNIILLFTPFASCWGEKVYWGCKRLQSVAKSLFQLSSQLGESA